MNKSSHKYCFVKYLNWFARMICITLTGLVVHCTDILYVMVLNVVIQFLSIECNNRVQYITSS